MVEDAANAGADLGHLLGRGKPVEAGHQRILQRRWDREGGQRARQHIVIALIDKEAGLENSLGQFLDEQGHAFCLGQDLVPNFERQASCRRPHGRRSLLPDRARGGSATAR